MKHYLVLLVAFFSMHQVAAESFDWYVKGVSNPKSTAWTFGEDMNNLAVSELILTEKLNWNYFRLIEESFDNKTQKRANIVTIFPRDLSGNVYSVVVDLNGTKRQLLESLANKMGISSNHLGVVGRGDVIDLNLDEPLSNLNIGVEEMTALRLVNKNPVVSGVSKQLVDNQFDEVIALEMIKISAILKDMGSAIEEDILRQPAATRAARAAKWIAELERTQRLVGHIAGGGGLFTEDF